MKKITISILLTLFSVITVFGQDCKDCNVLYCDGFTCDDGSSADGVMTSRKCGCGNEIAGACAKVEIDLTGHTEYNPVLPSALKFSTQESGNFSIYFSDQFCTVSSCATPDLEVSGNTNFEVPAGDVVYLTICKNGGNAGRRDLNFEYFPVQSNEIGYCDDGFDNDLDNLTDCEDPDCINSCEGTDSGVGGGLESNGRLGGKLAKRNFQLVKKGEPLFYPSSDTPQNLRIGKSSRNEHSINNFSDFLPIHSFNGLTVVEATPSGLNEVTNGDRIYALDASYGDDRVGSILMITTRKKVYEHTKPTCDRLMGYTLEQVSKKNYSGDSLITFKMTREGRVPEYGVSFSVRQIVPGHVILENHWTLDQYPEGDYTNIQIWTSSEERLESWVNEILENLRSFNPQMIVNSSEAPNTFVKRGWIEEGQLILEINGRGDSIPVQVSGFYSKTEIEESIHAFDFQFSMNEINSITRSLEIEDFCDLGLRISNHSSIGDDVYFADGQWGLDEGSSTTDIIEYEVTPSKINSKKEMKLRRDVSLKGVTQDYLTLYRSLHPRFKSIDVSKYNGLSFTAGGTGSIEILLVKNSIEEWSYQYKSTVMLVEEEMTYEIPFHQFKTTKNSEPFSGDDIVMVAFIMKSLNGEKTTMELSIKDLSFSVLESGYKDVATIDQQDLLAYPNPFSNLLEFQFNSNVEEPFELMITNIHGHIIESFNGLSRPGINRFKLSTHAYPEGMYFIHIKTLQKGSLVKKVYCKKI